MFLGSSGTDLGGLYEDIHFSYPGVVGCTVLLEFYENVLLIASNDMQGFE